MTGESRRTPITVANDSPLRELVRHGSCVTFRSPDRSTGNVWGRTSRTSGKMFDGHVERVVDVDSVESLTEELVEKSGFEDRDEWVEAIEELHGTVEGSVYRLTIDEWTVDEPEALLDGDAGEATDAGDAAAPIVTDGGDVVEVQVNVTDTETGSTWTGYQTSEVIVDGDVEAFTAYAPNMLPDDVTLEQWGRATGTEVVNELRPGVPMDLSVTQRTDSNYAADDPNDTRGDGENTDGGGSS